MPLAIMGFALMYVWDHCRSKIDKYSAQNGMIITHATMNAYFKEVDDLKKSLAALIVIGSVSVVCMGLMVGRCLIQSIWESMRLLCS